MCKDVIASYIKDSKMYISCYVVFIYLIDNLSIMSILCQCDKLASNMQPPSQPLLPHYARKQNIVNIPTTVTLTPLSCMYESIRMHAMQLLSILNRKEDMEFLFPHNLTVVEFWSKLHKIQQTFPLTLKLAILSFQSKFPYPKTT